MKSDDQNGRQTAQAHVRDPRSGVPLSQLGTDELDRRLRTNRQFILLDLHETDGQHLRELFQEQVLLLREKARRLRRG
ncbi:hypothetical protein [Azospirillum sp. SYSU D00513]|uniref:hypothetical protein n=1 Tax=Azospirillum sp. SYSU D00513 TaxID=2812561 RepID=UPI001A95813B|nr:hypothetical protein [Azospirillum sp. SYSU D00513]